MRYRAFSLRYTRDNLCLYSQYLLSRVEGSAHALTCRLRKIIALYAHNHPPALRMALITLTEIQILPKCLLGTPRTDANVSPRKIDVLLAPDDCGYQSNGQNV